MTVPPGADFAFFFTSGICHKTLAGTIQATRQEVEGGPTDALSAE